MQNASDQNLKQNVHIKSCECECLYYKDCVTSSIGDSTGIGLGFYFWVFSNQTTNFKKISLTHFCTVKCNVWNDWNCFFHIIRKAHKTESPVFSICWCGWCWVITLPLPITLAVLRPAWGSLQLFRAIKLNKMEPRCDHSAHSDHSVPSVPCPWFCSTLAPGVDPHSSWPTPFISINILLATGIAQFWLLMNSNYAFVGQPALNCILYILIFGAKNTIFRNLKRLLERFQI